MDQLAIYLTFNGNCREAMTFYRECLGGELYLQTMEESPMAEKLPAEIKNLILHASLRRDDFVLLGSDLVGEQGLKQGNGISILLNCSSEEELKDYYLKLSQGGQTTHLPVLTYWGALFGGLTDKYGHHWLFNFK